MSEVYRVLKHGNNGQTESTNIYILTFRRTTVPAEVKIGYMNCRVTIHIPNPRRCEQCQEFGHGKKQCNHNPVCAKCGKTNPEHDYNHCDGVVRCVNCTGDHPATAKHCPKWKFEKLVSERKIKNHLTYPEARKQIILENTELVEQIPSLQARKINKTYSSVTSSASPIEKQNQQQQFFEQQKQQLTFMQTQIQLISDILKTQYLFPHGHYTIEFPKNLSHGKVCLF